MSLRRCLHLVTAGFLLAASLKASHAQALDTPPVKFLTEPLSDYRQTTHPTGILTLQFGDGVGDPPHFHVERSDTLRPFSWLTITAPAQSGTVPLIHMPLQDPSLVDETPSAVSAPLHMVHLHVRGDGSGWAVWFPASGQATVWPFTAATADFRSSGTVMDGVVSVAAPPAGGPAFFVLASHEAPTVPMPSATSLAADDIAVRDALLQRRQDIVAALVAAADPPAEPPPDTRYRRYDALGQLTADCFRFRKSTQPLNENSDGLPDAWEFTHLVINEVCYANASRQPTDEDGRPQDWIEVFNPTDDAVPLDGFTITDSPGDPSKCSFPPGSVLEPGQYLLLLASGRTSGNVAVPVPGKTGQFGGPFWMHTNFTLKDSGEYLGLFRRPTPAAQPVSVDVWPGSLKPQYPTTDQNLSFGRTFMDGTPIFGFFTEPTPGGPNALHGALGLTHPPTFVDTATGAPAHGRVLAPGETVTVDVQPAIGDSTILYTLNGSWPTLLSDRWAGPITVSRTTIIRAIAVRPNHLPSRPVTRSFISKADTLAQVPPPAPPSHWSQPASDSNRLRYSFNASLLQQYGLQSHPDLMLDPTQPGSLACSPVHEALTAAPILHITRPFPDAFAAGHLGVSSAGAFEATWPGDLNDGPCSIEWIDPAHPLDYRQDNCGIRPTGEGSLGFRPTDKISFELHFRSEHSIHGATRFAGPVDAAGKSRIFPGSPVTSFDDLRAKHHDQDSWAGAGLSYWEPNADPVAEPGQLRTFPRLFDDPLCQEVYRSLGPGPGHLQPRHRWINVFINGYYWGVYDLSERPDEKWAAATDLALALQSEPNAPSSEIERLNRVHDPKRYIIVDPAADGQYFPLEHPYTKWTELITQLQQGFISWIDLQNFVDLDSYVDALIALLAGTSSYENPAILRHVYHNSADTDSAPPNWRVRFIIWDPSDAYNKLWNGSMEAVNLYDQLVSFDVDLGDRTEFKQRFKTRLALHLSTGGALTPSSFDAKVSDQYNALKGVIAADVARWTHNPDLQENWRLSPGLWLRSATNFSTRQSTSMNHFLRVATAAGYR